MYKKAYKKLTKTWFIRRLKTVVRVLYTFKCQLYYDLHNSWNYQYYLKSP